MVNKSIRNLTVAALLLIALSSPALGQNIIDLVELSPVIGDTLDKKENDLLELVTGVKDFQWAVFFKNDDNSVRMKYTYFQQGELQYSFDFSFGMKDELKETIEDRYYERNGSQVIVTTKNGDSHTGELLLLKNGGILIDPSGHRSYTGLQNAGASLQFIDSDDIELVSIPGKSDITGGLAYGALAGFAAGFFFDFFAFEDVVDKEDEESMLKVVIVITSAAAGAVIGLIAALLNPSDDQPILRSSDDEGNHDLNQYVRFPLGLPVPLTN
jgi:hypothetical protein